MTFLDTFVPPSIAPIDPDHSKAHGHSSSAHTVEEIMAAIPYCLFLKDLRKVASFALEPGKEREVLYRRKILTAAKSPMPSILPLLPSFSSSSSSSSSSSTSSPSFRGFNQTSPSLDTIIDLTLDSDFDDSNEHKETEEKEEAVKKEVEEDDSMSVEDGNEDDNMIRNLDLGSNANKLLEEESNKNEIIDINFTPFECALLGKLVQVYGMSSIPALASGLGKRKNCHR